VFYKKGRTLSFVQNYFYPPYISNCEEIQNYFYPPYISNCEEIKNISPSVPKIEQICAQKTSLQNVLAVASKYETAYCNGYELPTLIRLDITTSKNKICR